MNPYARFQPFAVRNKKSFTCSLATMLMMSAVVPAIAGTTSPITRPLAEAQDVGPVDAATPMTATVWLKAHNPAEFDAAVASRYDRNSPFYHQWLSAAELAGYGPQAADLATLEASLQASGLKIEHIAEDGTRIKVSGNAGTMQAAFGTTIHSKRLGERTFFTNTSKPTYQGVHPELVATISGLSNVGMQPFMLRQVDFATGLPTQGVPADQPGGPLSAFTTQCFGPDITAILSGFAGSIIPGQSGGVVATFTGPSYLDPTNTTTRPACGYTASQVATHYGLDEVYARGWTGKGETIVIVDSFGSQTIQADVNTFSQVMGLRPLTEQSFQIVYPDGPPDQPSTVADGEGWALETTLDVEWAHALAPDANIVLAVAKSDQDVDLASAIDYSVVHRLGNVISNSFGEPEAFADPSAASLFNLVFQKAAATGISANVATGDSGDFGLGTPVGAASIPADSPYATGVGGTSIGVPSDSDPVESVWGITLTQLGRVRFPLATPTFVGFVQGGGGGESVLLEKPGYQRKLPGTGRQLPDVSALADPQTGAICVQTDSVTGQPIYFPVGGTSLATPIFSAIWALANEAAGESLGQAAPALAAMPPSAFRDIEPIVARKDNTAGSITFRATTTTTYDPAQLLGLEQTQPDGFIGTLIFVGRVPFQGYNDVGFGTDSSLMPTGGWDNATGYGVPDGMRFIKAAISQAKDKF